MTAREKKLLALVGVIAVLWGLNLLRGKYVGWYDDAVAARDQAVQNQSTAELDYYRATNARKMLRRWEEKSLPSNIKLAESEYRNWLVDQLRSAKLEYEYVKPTSGALRGANTPYDHTPLRFSLQAEGSMEAILKFLDQFYRSDQLHKITKLSLLPKRTGSNISAAMDIEALSIQGLKRAEGLATGVSDRLAHPSSKDYLQRIGGRDLFAEYVPPRPPRPPVVQREPRPRTPPRQPPRFDDSERAFFNAAVQGKGEGGLQAWVNVRTTGESYQLSAGDKFEIGQLKGEVASVTLRQLVIDTNEGVLAIKIGDSLRSGKKVSGFKTNAGG